MIFPEKYRHVIEKAHLQQNQTLFPDQLSQNRQCFHFGAGKAWIVLKFSKQKVQGNYAKSFLNVLIDGKLNETGKEAR